MLETESALCASIATMTTDRVGNVHSPCPPHFPVIVSRARLLPAPYGISLNPAQEGIHESGAFAERTVGFLLQSAENAFKALGPLATKGE